jgi:hypothetical protein
MPSKSKAQHNLMEGVAHNAAFAKKVGIPQSVGKEFVAADKGKHFKKGGNMAKTKPVNPAMAMMAARAMRTPQATAPVNPMAGAAPVPGAMPGMKRGGMSEKSGGNMKDKAKEMRQAKQLDKLAKEERMEAKGYAKGGSTGMGPRNMSQDVEKGSNTNLKHGEHGVQKRGHTRAMHPKMAGNVIGTGAPKKMASGGSTSSRADGIAQRGKTKTKYC